MINAIKYCLNLEGIKIKDIDHIGFSYNPWLRLKEAIPEEKWEGLDSKIVDITVFLETIHKANVEVYELD